MSEINYQAKVKPSLYAIYWNSIPKIALFRFYHFHGHNFQGHAKAQTFFGNTVPTFSFHIGWYSLYQGFGMALWGIGNIRMGILYRQTMAKVVFLTIGTFTTIVPLLFLPPHGFCGSCTKAAPYRPSEIPTGCRGRTACFRATPSKRNAKVWKPLRGPIPLRNVICCSIIYKNLVGYFTIDFWVWDVMPF